MKRSVGTLLVCAVLLVACSNDDDISPERGREVIPPPPPAAACPVPQDLWELTSWQQTSAAATTAIPQPPDQECAGPTPTPVPPELLELR